MLFQLALPTIKPSADPARPWGETSAVKAFEPTTALHAQHSTNINNP